MAMLPLKPVRLFQDYDHNGQIWFLHEQIRLKACAPSERYTKRAHVQNYYEMMFFVQGEREIFVGGHGYSCRPGDLILFNPEEPHYGFNGEETEYERFYIHIYPDALTSWNEGEALMRCFIERPYCRDNHIRLPSPVREELFELLRQAEDAYAQSELLCGTYLLQLLIRLNRWLPPKEENATVARPKLLQQILFDINKTPGEYPTVQEMTKRYGISRSGLWRLFHTSLQLSPQEYLQLRRLSYAAQLLSGGSSVTEAALRSGFGECSRFIACFRRSYDMTPLQYKKQHYKGG